MIILAAYYSRVMDIPRAKVLRFDGLTKKEEFEIDNTEMFDNVKTIPPIGKRPKQTTEEFDSEQQ